MRSDAGIIISGTAPNSLGEAVVISLRRYDPEVPIVAIDLELNPSFGSIPNIHNIAIDLNPLTSLRGYAELIRKLKDEIHNAQRRLGFKGINTAILAAGTYTSGPLVTIRLEERQRLIGVNICGTLEVLHAVLEINDALGFSSRDSLSLTYVGTLHALASSPGKSVYVATKAFGLDLCVSLRRGQEVFRAIYFAPGQIDTPMLHRNHWVSKENGSVQFFDYVRSSRADLYRRVFVECDDDAFREAVSSTRSDVNELAETFSRYKNQRTLQLQRPEGVLQPIDLANCVVDVVTNADSHPDGVYIVTAPNRTFLLEQIAFSAVGRERARE
jgi:NADP-dependent 3-hydroxy acid dehydrogenase YdfG